MYRFHFIEGISRTDTPLFNNLSKQNVYFNKNTMLQIDEYYPPHYTNVIKCSVADINFNTRVNYVSLRHLDKWYYYFITSCNYVNEDIIEITINMDTFQTFMFDIEYHNSRINRELIKRWNTNGTINREYLRENFSSDKFINYYYKDYTEDRLLDGDGGCFLAKYIKKDLGTEVIRYATEVINDITGHYKDNALISILPAYNRLNINNDYPYYGIGHINPETGLQYATEWSGTDYNYVLYEYQSNVSVFMLYYVPFNPFKNIEVQKGTFTITGNKGIVWHYTNDDNNHFSTEALGNSFTFETSICETKIFSRDIIFNFSENKTRRVNFNYKYIPQLIDENYIRLRYGEKAHYTTYPLSLMNSIKLYGKYYCDILTGHRVAMLVDKNTDWVDLYNTTIVIDGYIQVPMVNDNWKNYMSTHKGDLTLGTAKDILGLGLTFVPGQSMLKRSLRQLGYKTRRGDTGPQAISNMYSRMEDSTNAYFTPNQENQGNNFTPEILSKGYHEMISIDYSVNIEQVATIYESIGYAVDKFVTGTPLVKNRTIYNYIQCDSIDFSLYSLSTEEMKNDLENRFIEGLRYWNIDEMNSLGLNLGDVCIYDNVEVSN